MKSSPTFGDVRRKWPTNEPKRVAAETNDLVAVVVAVVAEAAEVAAAATVVEVVTETDVAVVAVAVVVVVVGGGVDEYWYQYMRSSWR